MSDELAPAAQPAPARAATPVSAWVGLALPALGSAAATAVLVRMLKPAENAGAEWAGMGTVIVFGAAGLAAAGLLAASSLAGLVAALVAFGERPRTLVTWLSLLANLAILLPLGLAVATLVVAAAVR